MCHGTAFLVEHVVSVMIVLGLDVSALTEPVTARTLASERAAWRASEASDSTDVSVIAEWTNALSYFYKPQLWWWKHISWEWVISLSLFSAAIFSHPLPCTVTSPLLFSFSGTVHFRMLGAWFPTSVCFYLYLSDLWPSAHRINFWLVHIHIKEWQKICPNSSVNRQDH